MLLEILKMTWSEKKYVIRYSKKQLDLRKNMFLEF